MVFTGQHFVPYPVPSKKTFFAVNCNYFSFIHTRYDLEGNRKLRFVDEDASGMLNAGDTDITEYVWDHRNRLEVVMTDDVYGGDSPQVVEYFYDYQNRLVRKVLDSNGDGTTDSSTVYINNGDQIALEFEHTGTGDAAAADLSHRYLWGQAVDQLLADETVDDGGAEDVLWALTDHLNTVRDLAAYDELLDATTIANHITYDAYGKKLTETNAAADCLFAFTGRLFDEDTGLQNNLNRWYDAGVGRWLSEDPIGFEGGDGNLYRFVGNNPLDATDPSGNYEVRLPTPEETVNGPVNTCKCQNGMMVPVVGDGDWCTELHEWVHVLFDFPSNVCKNKDGTNKPDGAQVFYDKDDPIDQIRRSSGEIRATVVEMACQLYNGCTSDRPFWLTQLDLKIEFDYLKGHLEDLKNSIVDLLKRKAGQTVWEKTMQ